MTLPLLLLILPTAVQEPEEPPAQVYPLALQDVVRLVQENNGALARARLATLSAEGGLTEAGGAYDTVFFADVTYSYAQSPSSGFFTSFGDTKSREMQASQGLRRTLTTGGTMTLTLDESNLDANYLTDSQSDVGLSLRWDQPLLRGGWELAATRDLRRAEFERDRNRAGIRRASVETVQSAVDAYWDLAFTLADVEVKRNSLRLAEELREMTQAKYDVGAVAEVEVVQTEADIASRSDALLAAENAVREAQDRLRILLFALEDQTEWEWELQPSEALPQPEDSALEWQEAFETARQYRADLRELRVDTRRSRMEWRAARSDLKPQLDVFAQGALRDQDELVIDAAGNLFDYDYPGYTLGIVFELPFGNSQYEGAEQRLRYQHQIALRQLRDRENEVAQEVREAVRDLRYQGRRVAVTKRAREVAQRQLEAEQRRLVEGASTNFQVLQFQTDLAVAESQEAQARVDYAKAMVRVNTVRGLNWDGVRPELAGLEDYRPGSEFDS